jgi:drug/metabolite transporter (DMT)-like permease
MNTPSPVSHPFRTRLLLVITVSVWGATFVATKICLRYLPPLDVLGLRLLLAVPTLYGLILLRRITLSFSKKELLTLVAGSGILIIHFFIQITGLQFTSATNTGWIISVTPLIILLLSRVLLKETVHRADLAGVTIASLGIVLLISNGDFTSLGWLESPGDWLVLASAHTWALYTVIGRNISRAHNPIAIAFAFLAPAMVAVIGTMAFVSDWVVFVHLPAEPVIALLFLGVVAMALANWWWQSAVGSIGAAKAGVFLYLEPLATMVLAVPLLHEAIGAYTAAGGALILGGVYIAQMKR